MKIPGSSGSLHATTNRILLTVGLVLSPPLLRADHQQLVVISATASKNYTQGKFTAAGPKSESYIFYRGRFFEGETRDRSIDGVSFKDIARTLAPSLAKQNYLPAHDIRAANLLIVVNWGTTLAERGADKNDVGTQSEFDGLVTAVQKFNAPRLRLQTAAAGLPPPGTSPGDMGADLSDNQLDTATGGDLTNAIMMDKGTQQASKAYANLSARLLGYSDVIDRETARSWARPGGLSDRAETLLTDLSEERYFVILLAYDYQEILRSAGQGKTAARKGEPQRKPLWSVRMNVRAVGNNFTMALPAMGKAASDYFGRQLDDLVTARTSDRQGQVEVGTPKVMDLGK